MAAPITTFEAAPLLPGADRDRLSRDHIPLDHGLIVNTHRHTHRQIDTPILSHDHEPLDQSLKYTQSYTHTCLCMCFTDIARTHIRTHNHTHTHSHRATEGAKFQKARI